MKIFPTKELRFKLLDTKAETIERLKRRTEFSEKMRSKLTEKSFIGTLEKNQFKIISSEIGKGAFCVMSGKIDTENSYVNVEINKIFRFVLSVFFTLPVLGIILEYTKHGSNLFILISVAVLQIVLIRYFVIGLVFSRMSKQSLNKLRDVLDIEFIE